MKSRNAIVNIFKWVARVFGFLASVFFLSFFIGEGGFTEFVIELLPTIILIGGAIAGYIISWFKGRLGGIIMIAGGLGQGIYLLILGGIKDLDAAWVFALPFIIPGCIFFFIERKIYKLSAERGSN